MGVSCGRGKEDENLMFKSIFRKEILCFGRASFFSPLMLFCLCGDLTLWSSFLFHPQYISL